MKWRPIETAPLDGIDVIVWDPYGIPQIVVARFEDGQWIYADELLADAAPEGPMPPYWMPLPESPEESHED